MEDRIKHILDTMMKLIIEHGYNKVTMNDLAEDMGLSRGLIYVHFKSKDELFEALLKREMLKYGTAWIEYIEADADGGSVASVYRGILYALQNNPLMSAIVTRDERTLGKYLRKSGNIFESLNTPNLTADFLQAMADAQVIRKDINIQAMAYILDTLSFGLVSSNEIRIGDSILPFEDVMQTIADMLERMLTPENGGNREAGKAVLRQFAENARAYFTQLEIVKE